MPDGMAFDPPYRSHPESLAAMRRRFRTLMRRCLYIPERRSLPEWADEYRILSGKSSARPGKWKTSKVEVARGPMLSLSEPGVKTISLMVATQLLKTSFIENIIAYHIHIDPCPILAVYPNEDAAEAFSKERLAPMIAATPVLKERVGDPLSRKSDNTIYTKHFPGGFIAMVSAGSPMDLSARPIRVVLQDEVDKYKPTKEGDPIGLAEERMSTFPNRLSVRACSPTTEETSRIYLSYMQSDQRRAYVSCPHCGYEQYLEFFKHVHWEKRGSIHNASTAAIFCEKCHEPWNEDQRLEAIQSVRWFQTRKFICCGEGQEPRQTRLWDWDEVNRIGYAVCSICKKRTVSNMHAGFTVSKLYSPFLTIPELAQKWLDAKDDPEQRQVFYNTQLALPYKTEATKEVQSKVIASRREIYEKVPDRAVVITAGVDVQSGDTGSLGRLEVETVAWDPYEESWSMDYRVFTGDPAKPEIWRQLDEYLLTPWERFDGRKMKILGVCVDSGGHHTEEVYQFCLARLGRNVWATKGASDRSGQWSPVWPARDFRKFKRRTHRHRPVIIGVNAAKEAIRQRLLIMEPGPGYCHFPVGRPDGYFDQLTSERLEIERRQNMVIRKWILKAHQANEALDTRVLAYAAFQGLKNDRGFQPNIVARMLHQELPPLDTSADEPEEEPEDDEEGVDNQPEEAEDQEPAEVAPPPVTHQPIPQPVAHGGTMVVRRPKIRAARSGFMSRRF